MLDTARNNCRGAEVCRGEQVKYNMCKHVTHLVHQLATATTRKLCIINDAAKAEPPEKTTLKELKQEHHLRRNSQRIYCIGYFNQVEISLQSNYCACYLKAGHNLRERVKRKV
ncbi:hypothetical protein ACLKA7_007254 [Drosophila subpalustris]